MARRTIHLLGMLALVSGCGDSTPASLTDKGLRELRSGHYDQAIATCTEAIRLDPKDAAAYVYRGRAYQFRNALGDPKQAIADFSEAIRLAPHSSDAYYSRALVYRDLGQIDLAQADDRAAREADGTVQDVYRRLSDTTPAILAKARQDVKAEQPAPGARNASGGVSGGASLDGLPQSEAERKEWYEKLKEEFEPGFGSVRTRASDADDSKDSQTESDRRTFPTPINESGTSGGATFDPLRGPPSLEPESEFSTGKNAARNPPRTPPQTPQSPFAQRAPSGIGPGVKTPPQSPFGAPLQSPFGQRPPAPTGYVEPLANPFSAPSSVGPFSAQPRQIGTNPFSNPAVRNPFPRDYVP